MTGRRSRANLGSFNLGEDLLKPVDRAVLTQGSCFFVCFCESDTFCMILLICILLFDPLLAFQSTCCASVSPRKGSCRLYPETRALLVPRSFRFQQQSNIVQVRIGIGVYIILLCSLPEFTCASRHFLPFVIQAACLSPSKGMEGMMRSAHIFDEKY